MSETVFPETEETQVIPEAAIRAQLNRVLNEHPLRSSNRCQKFLNFVVEKKLQGEDRDIKERFIGVEVFGRPLDYDPASDPVVRLVAGETRKRIAQYYVQKEHEHELRIEVLPGTYVPTFHWPHREHQPSRASSADSPSALATSSAPHAQDATPAPRQEVAITAQPIGGPVAGSGVAVEQHTDPSHQDHKLLISAIAAGVFVCVVATLSAWWIQTAPSRALKAFWHPLVASGSSNLICIGDLNSSTEASFSSDDSLQHIQQTHNHVGPYDVGALARLAGMLGSMSRPFNVMLADNTNLTDLRAQPGILIGAFDNQWTPVIFGDRRFQFHSDPTNGTVYLIDSKNPSNLNWSLNVHQPMRAITHDTGLISRVVSHTTGNVELLVAGIGPYGTSAASEYVTNPDYFKEFTDRAPKDWKDHDIEIVVSTDVVDGRSGPPHMLVFDVH